MKIFNWMHKRFHQNLQKDGFDRIVKKPDLGTTSDLERQALLKQVALVNVLDGWRDGILTIGTFGLQSFEPPTIISQKHDYLILQNQEEDDDQEETYSVDNVEDANDEDNDNKYEECEEEEEEEEMNPLMFTTFDCNFDDIESEFGANVVKPDVPLTPFYGSSEIQPDLGVAAINQRENKGERVTLADLFSADSEVKKKPKLEKIELDSGKLQGLKTKNGLSFAKKLIPLVGEDSRPIKKLNRLMRKMLKRKIHPELEGRAQKFDDQVQATEPAIACESVALLPTPAEPAV
ncbi:protein TILLER ANGLE CONTROL 1 [Tripterygium wilfordii]|uniref:protein TILLER ANGLE CONTROL 1 n=1 Tax=Tripterygium wilfordii TaxID=458696 RepID=UPI0018F822D4|nr:protein TILLER ANGLE CONTROL 1 [Tripterygium wilfordii]